MRKTLSLFVLFTLFATLSNAQLIWTDPAFPRADDEVTVYFNAQEGTGGLAGCNCDVYVHTGLITSASTSQSDWKNVQTTWGVTNPNWKMTPVSGQSDIYSWTISPSVKSFYQVGNGVTIEDLAFVFRNGNGSKEGKGEGGSDIFYPIYPDDLEFAAAFFAPQNSTIGNVGETISVFAGASEVAELSLYDNGNLLVSEGNVTTLNYDLEVTEVGTHLVELVADNGSEILRDTVFYTGNPVVVEADPPAGLKLGANYIDDSSVTLVFYASDKDFIYVLGDFNDWVPSEDYYMNRSVDGTTWWLELTGLTPNQQYGLQYWVDGEIKVADPHSELILDPWNDGNIPAVTFPNMHPYPTGKTSGHVTLIHPGKPAFDWEVPDFEAPEPKDLVIYELLVRDFVHRHDYETLIDTLDYLENLGINAIELMPPGEFENNESWGYNPSYHMALDKYYGTPEAFKRFIDECHKRGIAVILDIVLNHAFGQSPMVNLYWDAANNRPAANSPWFNSVCPHEPFCWGYDYNHNSQATKNWMDRVNTYWLEEYNLDGFRFDFTKGFSQVGDVGFDAARINNIKRMADVIWDTKPGAYIILEHWADNSEEKILSSYGMMLWANVTHQYAEASMGYISGSNFDWGIYKERGYNEPHLVSYMESHDEERMMYKNLTWGNSNGSYSIKDPITALQRVELAATFFYTIPGPKMLWQFGEVGYDVSIDDPCRVCNKPILWNYFEEPARKRLYDVTSELIHLRNEHEVFRADDFTYTLSNSYKRITLKHPDMNAVVIGNFGMEEAQQLSGFPHDGVWYEYFTGDSLFVQHIGVQVPLQAGEYRIYTDKPLTNNLTTSSFEFEPNEFNARIFPNPSEGRSLLTYELPEAADVQINIFHISGQLLETIRDERQQAGEHYIEMINDFEAGTYLIQIRSGAQSVVQKWMIW
jgi:pullulanase/glycogen debranching enzyme